MAARGFVDARRLEAYSRLLADPELLYTLIFNSERVTVFHLEVGRDPLASLRDAVFKALPLVSPSPAYLLMTRSDGGVTARVLAARGRLVGLTVEVAGREYTGSRAVEELGEHPGRYTVTVHRVKARIAEWTPEYSVHVRSMDEQHRRFFELLNKLYETLLSGRLEEEGEAIMYGLATYTRAHFRSEEAIMERYGYPGFELEQHRREHRLFARIVEDYQDKFEKDPTGLGMELFHVTTNWFKDHILGTDRRYGEYFRKLGIRVE